jgi:ring-1,2-phenylacetyl-CoA epoxidase subunit PaaB
MNSSDKDTQWTLWEVFTQEKAGKPHEHAGSVRAPDKEMALQNARDVYSRRNEATCIWVVASENIVSSTPEDIASFFEPANDKIYRHPNFYKTPEGIKQI